MNPIKITLLTLAGWVILTIICVLSIEDISEKPFALVLYSFYFAPLVCLIAFIVSSCFYRLWVNNHKIVVAVTVTIFVIWVLIIILYLRSLFVY